MHRGRDQRKESSAHYTVAYHTRVVCAIDYTVLACAWPWHLHGWCVGITGAPVVGTHTASPCRSQEAAAAVVAHGRGCGLLQLPHLCHTIRYTMCHTICHRIYDIRYTIYDIRNNAMQRNGQRSVSQPPYSGLHSHTASCTQTAIQLCCAVRAGAARTVRGCSLLSALCSLHAVEAPARRHGSVPVCLSVVPACVGAGRRGAQGMRRRSRREQVQR
jgi:hypothetical protein